MHDEHKTLMMLKWVVGDSSSAHYIFIGEGKIMEEELVKRLPDSFRDKNGNISLFDRYFDNNHSWNKYMMLMQSLKIKKMGL